MKGELIFNTNLHFEHENWSRELSFWEDELSSFQNRLDELAVRWTDKSVLAQIDKFQNQFLLEKEAIHSIKDQIGMHETNMAHHYEKDEDVLNKELVLKHVKLRERMENERELFHGMKSNLFRFLTKYM
jgi:hypothetical protein